MLILCLVHLLQKHASQTSQGPEWGGRGRGEQNFHPRAQKDRQVHIN